MNDNSEQTAERIAERGREALVARLRPAFAEAVSAHADVLSLDEAQIEEMVQSAADRADGLQWRRALASVATDELGISLGEALGHPAVARAQTIVGAPSYEESLAKLGLVTAGDPEPPVAPPSEPPVAADAAEPVVEELVEVVETMPAEPPAAHEPSPTEAIDVTELPDAEPVVHPGETAEHAFEHGGSEEYDAIHATAVHENGPLAAEPLAEPDADVADEGPLRLTATHLGGIATLQPGEQNLELRFGDAGLDIARRPGRVLGRLRWPEISALEVPSPRGLRRRRRQERAQLVVHTEHGDASFEIPAVAEDELRESVETVLARYRPA